MNIVHVTARYPPHLGGIEEVVRELARRQAGRGHQVRVLTAAFGPVRAGTTDEDGVSVHRLAACPLGTTPVIPSLRRELVGGPRPDVVHVHGTLAGLAEQVTSACRALQVPYVAHLHLLVRPSTPAGRILLGPYQRFLYAHHLQRAARVICLTSTMAAAVNAHYGVEAPRLAVIANGAPELSDPAPAGPGATVLFVGRLTDQKGILPLIEAMGRLPAAQLVVVGEGDQACEAHRLVARLDLGNVTFRGRQPAEAVASAYREATVLVMPSSHEGLPLVLLEAMAAGLPVIAAAIPELVEAAGGAFLPLYRTTPDEIAGAVARCLDSPGLRAHLREAGRGVAVRHSWERATDQVHTVYEAAVYEAAVHRAGRSFAA